VPEDPQPALRQKKQAVKQTYQKEIRTEVCCLPALPAGKHNRKGISYGRN
jgi:hypothetical protein